MIDEEFLSEYLSLWEKRVIDEKFLSVYLFLWE